MIRKLIKQGHNTLTLTIPSTWAKRFNLSSGDEINLIERDNGLFITTEKNNKPSRIEINLSDLSTSLIWKHITTAYREGYDEIAIKFEPNSVFDSPYKYFAHYIVDMHFLGKDKLTPHEFVNQLCSRFVGFEIINHGNNFCILKEIGQSTSKEFDSSLRRIFLLLLDLSEGLISDLEKNDDKFLIKAHILDMQIDKFHDFCIRVLNKYAIEEPSKSALISMLIFLLELVGDEFKHLAIQIKRKDPKKLNVKKMISNLNYINQELRMFYELYYQYDKSKLIGLFKMNKSFSDEGNEKKNSYKEDVQVTVESINRYIDVLSEVLIAKQVSSHNSV